MACRRAAGSCGFGCDKVDDQFSVNSRSCDRYEYITNITVTCTGASAIAIPTNLAPKWRGGGRRNVRERWDRPGVLERRQGRVRVVVRKPDRVRLRLDVGVVARD